MMTLGKVIRKYRKGKSMTQEEMAARLGVSAPAVNKWENENSYPDIMLLAPIARLLEISLDTLLSFQEDLTREEIQKITVELDEMLKKEPYDQGFCWVKKKLEQYPNCGWLIISAAVILDAQCIVQKPPCAAEYEEYISSSTTVPWNAATKRFAFGQPMRWLVFTAGRRIMLRRKSIWNIFLFKTPCARYSRRLFIRKRTGFMKPIRRMRSFYLPIIRG